ncbi:flavin reductase family protein [Pseudonocardia acidicola]|uniref:Flavin reductase family protein n=1 Tax=Pseudonocardia acidicola TaxID=2724939 RepID=A0ABX1S7R8_9PSEU|nr:flavin reductase family protein [Pseudonocardia acidicola]NMH96513.1 flavin reductase family protein [Pseudonocardia acidicola]
MSDLDMALFRAAMADLPAGVSIVTTTAAGGSPRGATVSAVASVSLSPAMLLVCLDQRSDTLAALARGRHFLVHIAADGQQEHVMRFAGKGADKFIDAAWHAGMSGQPQLAGATAVFDCVVAELVSGGDHTIVLGEITAIQHEPENTPVVYHRRRLAPAPAA